ncbi:hypothetical protein BGZ65_009848, partial [Modicella reniformis]
MAGHNSSTTVALSATQGHVKAIVTANSSSTAGAVTAAEGEGSDSSHDGRNKRQEYPRKRNASSSHKKTPFKQAHQSIDVDITHAMDSKPNAICLHFLMQVLNNPQSCHSVLYILQWAASLPEIVHDIQRH